MESSSHEGIDVNEGSQQQDSSQITADEIRSQFVGFYIVGSMIMAMLIIIITVCLCRYCRKKRRDERVRLKYSLSNSNSNTDSSSISPKHLVLPIEGATNDRCYNQAMNLGTIYENRTLSGTELDVESESVDNEENLR